MKKLSFKSENLIVDYFELKFDVLPEHRKQKIVQSFFKLGFNCIKDINAIKQLSDFKSTLKNPGTWIIRKSKQTIILVFSKEVLVAVFIFFKSDYNVDSRLLSSSQVYQSCVSKSDNVVFLTSPSYLQVKKNRRLVTLFTSILFSDLRFDRI